MTGLFIAIYGINNIGKSTQIRSLLQRLHQHGISAVSIKYPVYDLEPTGPQLNAVLRSQNSQQISEEELQTLFMQNRKDFEPKLEELLKEYQVILAEDYTGTGIAWGMAKGLTQEYLEDLNKNLRKEDYAFLLKGKRTIAAKESQHIHESDDLLVLKVGSIFEQLALQKNWHVIDVQPKPSQTTDLLWQELQPLLRNYAQLQ